MGNRLHLPSALAWLQRASSAVRRLRPGPPAIALFAADGKPGSEALRYAASRSACRGKRGCATGLRSGSRFRQLAAADR